MHHITGRIPAALLAAFLLALLVASAAAGFSGTLLGPGLGASQSFSIASLSGDKDWSSASLISQASTSGFGARTRSIMADWTPPENQVYTLPTRPVPSFMQSDGNSPYDWDTLFAKPVPYCGCGCS
jgi:hypothetical protein